MSTSTFIRFTVCSVIFLLIAYLITKPDGKFHIVFCDVGQGDGIYMNLPDGSDVVIDGGPNTKILSCLGKYMLFWDRTIELVILTHSHEDHFKGLTEVLKRYEVKSLIIPPVENKDSDSFKEFIQTVENEHTQVKNMYQGDWLKGGGGDISFRSLWPDKKWLSEKTGTLLKNPVWSVPTTHKDLNDFSQVLLVSYKDFDVLLTGDAEADILSDIQRSGYLKKNVEVLKVAHQGNKKALTTQLVDLLDPTLGIIFVGKNSYGHPSDETIKLLEKSGAIVKRTDRDGSIHIVSDGIGWTIK